MRHRNKVASLCIALSLLLLPACRQVLEITGADLVADLAVPDKNPSGLAAYLLTDTTVTLTWIDAASDEYSYEVEKCTGVDCTEFAAVSESPIPENSVTHIEEELTPNQVYRFRIRVVRPAGKGDWVTTSDITTLATLSVSFTIGSLTSTSISFSWTDLATGESGYEVERCLGSECTNFTSVSASPLPENSTNHTEAGLSAGTVYRFRVRPVALNEDSLWLTSADIVTLLTGSTSLTATSKTSSSITLAFDDPSSIETGFEMQRCSAAGCTSYATVSSSPLAANVTTHSETGLSPSTIYRFRVRPLSALGPGEWTQSSEVITAPAEPTGLALASGTDVGLVLSWTDVASNEFVYEVQRCTGASCSNFSAVAGSPLAADSTGFTDAGLSTSTVYRYRVRATTAAADSSDWVTSSDLSTGPAAPSGLVTSGVTESAVTLTWTDNAAVSETYEVEMCSGVSCTNFAAVTASPLAADSVTHTETGLTGNTSYTFRVRAVSGSAKSAWLTSSSISTLAPIGSCASPTTVVVDTGVKSNVAAMARGVWSDAKKVPSTNYPATAYYDGSATGGTLGIKFAYWDGDEFKIESVSGDLALAAGSATWVKLAFLNTGVPMVFWTTGGTTVRAAMRSAAIGTVGVWSSVILETFAGGATRALEVSVSPADHVGVVYLTNTATTGRLRFIACPAPCTSLSSFVTMSGAGDAVQNNAVTAASMGTGVAWCRTAAGSPGSFIPLVTYLNSTANAVMYSRCTGTLTSTCLTTAGWSGNANSVAAVSSTLAQVYVDPAIVGDKPKVLYRNAATSLVVAVNANNCDAAPGAWTASGAIGGATTGTAWAELMKDSSDKFHIVANTAATSVSYFNSSTTTASGAWAAVGTVETVALPAAGAGGGGADINTSTGEIFTSYSQSAVVPNQLLLSVINDYTVASNVATSYQMIPDTTGNINLSLTAGGNKRNVSVAATSTGKPGVAYVDYSIGAAAGALLKYSFRNGNTAATSWESPKVLYVPGTPSVPSLAFDHLDLPWIGYFDAANFKFMVATNSQSDGSGAWAYYQFPVDGKTSAAVAPALDDIVMVMSYSAGVSTPVAIVMNSTVAGGAGVKLAKFSRTDNAFGATITTIPGLGAAWGTRLTADFDTNGNIVVAFYDLTATRVKFNLSNDGGTSWEAVSTDLPYTTAVTSGREGLSIKLNPNTTKPAVSYYDRINNKVGYVS